MPRTHRLDEAGGLHQALNRGSARSAMFRKDADYEEFERILGEELERYDMQWFAFQLMTNPWQFVLPQNCTARKSLGEPSWIEAIAKR